LGVADHVVAEPMGGAHRDATTAMAAVGVAIQGLLDGMKDLDGPALIKDRQQKYLDLGSKGLAA